MRCFDSASAGSANGAMSNTSTYSAMIMSTPAAEVAAQTASAAAGRDGLTPVDTANTARPVAGSKVLECYSADGERVDVRSSRNGTSTDVAVKTIIRDVMIPRSDPANPASSFKLDVRFLLHNRFDELLVGRE